MTSRQSLLSTLAAIAVGVSLWAQPASACAACACGSQAALPAGSELPFANRVRTVVGVTSMSTVTSDHLGTTHLTALTLVASVMATVVDGVAVDALVPVGARMRATDGVVDGHGLGLGDVQLGARLTWRDRAFGPRLALGGRLGVSVPTTTRIPGLSEALQPGDGAVATQVSVQAIWFATPTLTALVTGAAAVPVAAMAGHAGAAVVDGRASALWRATDRLSVRLGLAGRGVGDDGAATHGSSSSSSGSAARAWAGPEVGTVFAITPDVMVAATAALPVVTSGPIVDGGVADLAVLVDW